jgi:hypothetical protein
MSWNQAQKQVIQVPRLEPKDLYDRRVKRDHARLRSYNTLLEQIYHRVYATSQLSGNTSSVLYTVPPFVLGLPKLDMEDCIVYLVWQLRQNGFEIRFTWPNLLYISWRHHEGDYLMKHNPIIKAMTPEPIAPPRPSLALAPPPNKKEKPVLSFQREIEMIASGPFQPQGRSLHPQDRGGRSMVELNNGPRRAMDYEPPASFLQNMDRPVRSAQPKGNVLADLWG